jgi:hypothetical protein
LGAQKLVEPTQTHGYPNFPFVKHPMAPTSQRRKGPPHQRTRQGDDGDSPSPAFFTLRRVDAGE